MLNSLFTSRNQAVLPGPGDGLGPHAEVEFVVDVRDVIFDGVIDVKHFSGHVASCKNVTDGGYHF